jgi:hypothetical protein
MRIRWTHIAGSLSITCSCLLLGTIIFLTGGAVGDAIRSAVLLSCFWFVTITWVIPADQESYLKLYHDFHVRKCKKYVKGFVELHKFDSAHDFAHCTRVYETAAEALRWSSNTPHWIRLAVELGALLHEVDDRKCAPSTKGQHLPHARLILKEVFKGEGEAEVFQYVVDAVLESIDLTSASKNGNRFPDKCAHPLLLVVRFADRLTAVGGEGIRRCLQYTLDHGQPISTLETPNPTTLEQLRTVCKGRFERYQGLGKSASAVDHIFDKLAHLSHFEIPEKYRLPPLMFLMGRLREADSEVTDFALAHHDPTKFLPLLIKHVSTFHALATCNVKNCPTCIAVDGYTYVELPAAVPIPAKPPPPPPPQSPE